MSRITRDFAVAIALVLGVVDAAAAAPSQLDQAKKVYAEGKALLEARNYVDAIYKFEEAYRLAPDKHLFNYNIASAAELAGDCVKAGRHYKMFLDLVPEHDARADATKALAKVEASCVPPEQAVDPIADRGDREAERTKAIGERALGDALRATDQSVARYEAVLARHGRQQPFAGIVRAKRRDSKKLAKVIAQAGYEAGEPFKGEVSAPGSVEHACRQAETQEERNAAVYGKVYDLFDDEDIVKLMDKLLRRVEGRHLRAFRDTCPR